MRSTVLALGMLALFGCGGDAGSFGPARRIETPAGPGSGEPGLAVGANGTLYLTWIEPEGDGHALRFATWQGDRWSDPRTIASGDDWFVNWADFPSVAATHDGTLLAHWLTKSGSSTYAYDVTLAVSRDGGRSWSEPFSPHTDGTRTEHGFVTIAPRTDGTFDLVWLDGRETAVDERDEPTGTGVMTLRSATVGRDGGITGGKLIDDRVCDCCSTDAARDGDGTLVVAYRDRSENDVRDIAAARLEAAGWSPGGLVARDDWKISGCPVNGPALAASGSGVIAAWFTAPHQKGEVKVAFSSDGGRTFGPPIRIDDGEPVGRVDVVSLDDGTAVVSWLEHGAVRLRRVGPAGAGRDTVIVARTDDSRAAGFPRMGRVEGDIFVAWTEPGEPSRVRTAVLPADRLPLR